MAEVMERRREGYQIPALIRLIEEIGGVANNRPYTPVVVTKALFRKGYHFGRYIDERNIATELAEQESRVAGSAADIQGAYRLRFAARLPLCLERNRH